LAGFLHCASETRWEQFGQFLNDFLDDFLYENLHFLYEILMMFLIFSFQIVIVFWKILDFLYETSQ